VRDEEEVVALLWKVHKTLRKPPVAEKLYAASQEPDLFAQPMFLAADLGPKDLDQAAYLLVRSASAEPVEDSTWIGSRGAFLSKGER
jgi:hypothetical protein